MNKLGMGEWAKRPTALLPIRPFVVERKIAREQPVFILEC